MDGTPLASELAPEPRSAGSLASRARLRFDLATPADDPDLRRLLRETPMAGAIQLTFEREPNAFTADATEGDFHQTLIARDPAGRIVAMGGRSVRDAWVNGGRTRLGYLGQLRIAPESRGRDMLVGGYALLRQLHDDGRAPFYLTAVLADNLPARRLLEAGVRGLPTYRPVSEWVTLAIPTRQSRPRRTDAIAADRSDVTAITQCLSDNNRRFQFAPVWEAADVEGSARTPGLRVEDLSVVRRNGRIAGCAAVWDQRAFKQVVVRGYDNPLRRWRRAINLLAPLTGWPRLPDPGQELRQAHLAAVAVDGDDAATFTALLARSLAAAVAKGCDYLLAGFAANHPLLDAARQFRHRAVRSVLYCVHWPDGRQAAEALDGRTLHVEVATL